MSVVEFIADFPDYFLTYSVPNYVFGFFALLVFPVVVLPVLIKFDLTERAFTRACAYCFGGLAIVLYGDLPFRAAQAQWLCKTRAGLHVYEAVHTDGFIAIAGREFLDRGFSFIENDSNQAGLSRMILIENLFKVMKVDTLLSKYKLYSEPRSYFCCEENRYTAKNIDSGRLLGEAVSIVVSPGWAASFLFSIIPAERTNDAYTCSASDELPTRTPKNWFSPSSLVGTVLLPTK